ncbi:RNA-binding motif protein, X-linked 2 [Stylophora pistillata]|uniref:RNA-binding motif protein, X-linked 2 n=1 Tax=Stylophora pistillata TaxID=50429 RepID=A0A2B4ST23_STYPI|nr:RNA-binding motif protein, X-linked 2 [Stylophora pistillata]
MNERMLEMGVEDSQAWHKQYKDSAYVFIGESWCSSLHMILIFNSQRYGEIVNINLVRDKKTGKSKGYCFLCYEDQRSTILAVDNFNGIKLGGRIIRVDHCSNYRRPLSDEKDEHGKRKEIIEEGCAPKTPSPSPPVSEDEDILELPKKRKKEKKTKKEKKHKEDKWPKKKKMMSSSVEEDLKGPKSRKRRGSEDDNRDMLDQDLLRDRDLRNVEASVMRDSGRDRDFGDHHVYKQDRDSKDKNYHDVHRSDRKHERELNERDRETRKRESDIRERHREAQKHEFRDNHISNNRREQRDKDFHHSSRDNRMREVDERKRDRFDRRGDHREEGTKPERRDRSNFGDRRERR